ncbi:MAG TPA: hypothetical protein PLM71_05395 [Syntrophorhabdaceae bacterium]|nr:hypothetical protein [Syntrophorhabdaceae bacterium]HPU29738.1 hypothetical protein [Syntrophorhabdaceae bacterium]
MKSKGKKKSKGVAMVLVLMIILISSLLVAAILYFLGRGTEVSILEKNYKTAKEASYGALEFFIKDLIPTTISFATATPESSITSVLSSLNLTTNTAVTKMATDVCVSSKLLSATSSWDSTCVSDTNIKVSSDIKFTLNAASGPPYDVYVKIVDTVAGNTNTGGVMLEGTGVAESASGVITPQHFPYMYSIEVQGEKKENPQERAQLEVLYAY